MTDRIFLYSLTFCVSYSIFYFFIFIIIFI
jgi:hypothetical protein